MGAVFTVEFASVHKCDKFSKIRGEIKKKLKK